MHAKLIITAILSVIFFLPSQAVFASDYTEDAAGVKFVRIKGGTFLMGDHEGKDTISLPSHEVTVNDFYIGKYEVTFAEFDKFCRETKRPFPSDNGWGRNNQPVINVTWDDAVAFTEWLSSKSSRRFRLPTEAEWEYAARGGTTTSFYWGNKAGKNNANCDGCGMPWDGKEKKTVKVGSFKPNPYGLYDMSGNVYEWTLDSRHTNYDGAPTDGSAWVNEKETHRINRGGSWRLDAVEIRSDRRCWDAAKHKSNELGFRVVMEP